MDLIREIYRITETFPQHEKYGLVSQMRRSAISIPANIAEGHGRYSTREYLRFLAIAVGSLRELETYVDVSLDLKYLEKAELAGLEPREERIGRMLTSLRGALIRRLSRGRIPNP